MCENVCVCVCGLRAIPSSVCVLCVRVCERVCVFVLLCPHKYNSLNRIHKRRRERKREREREGQRFRLCPLSPIAVSRRREYALWRECAKCSRLQKG